MRGSSLGNNTQPPRSDACGLPLVVWASTAPLEDVVARVNTATEAQDCRALTSVALGLVGRACQAEADAGRLRAGLHKAVGSHG
jgi:hypothetical protein